MQPLELCRVLLVEDDAAVRGLANVALADLGGLEVLACGSGTEAIRVAPLFAPHAMVLDVQLPDTDGPRLAERLRALPGMEAVPAILLTGRPETVTSTVSPRTGIIGVLPKPFDPLTLADTVRGLWQTWREIQA